MKNGRWTTYMRSTLHDQPEPFLEIDKSDEHGDSVSSRNDGHERKVTLEQ